jgi:hypothetical protein
MSSFVRWGVVALSLCVFLFSTSCEKHPLGQLPEGQREQPDPAKIWSNPEQQEPEAQSTSGTPAEAPHQSR